MSRPSLLIVDDDIRLLQSLAGLPDQQFDIFTSSNEEEGLSIMDDQHPSLLFLDLNIQRMTGVEVL